MKRTILTMILMPILMLLPAVTFMEPVYACGTTSAAQKVSAGIDQTTTTPSGDCGDSGVKGAISLAVQILSLIVGVASVIVVIVSGFKYITSNGDAGKVGNAKNTLIYALIGLAIAALAQFLVHFVLNQSSNVANPVCPSNSAILKSDPGCK